MAVLDVSNNVMNPAIAQEPLLCDSIKEKFLRWLVDGNAKKYTPPVLVSNFDRISEYALKMKISPVALWEIKKRNIFASIYSKVLEAKMLRIREQYVYKVFIVAGKLYLKFLKEKPFTSITSLPLGSAVVSTKIIEPTRKITESKNGQSRQTLSQIEIIPEDVIDWLITQPNTNGKLYLKNVARQYMYSLCSAPLKLNMLVEPETRNVFACYTVEALKALWRAFKDAPNYKEINRIYSGGFSAGMSCLLRYLEHIADTDKRITHKKTKVSDYVDELSFIQDSRGKNSSAIDFTHPEQYTFTDPVECDLYGHKVRGKNWRILLMNICEHFIAEENKEIYSFRFHKSREFLVDERPSNQGYKQLSNGKYIVVSYDIPTLIKIIGNLCKHCRIDLNEVVITYVYKKNASIENQIQNQIETVVTSKVVLPSAIDNIVDLDEGKNEIREILHTHFQILYGYSNANILWHAAQDTLAMFLNDNAINNVNDLWILMQRFFSGEYVLSFPHIWKNAPDYPRNCVGIIVNLARQFEGIITREQINDYFARIKQSPPTNAAIIRQGLLLFYGSKEFILTEMINLTSEDCILLNKALDTLFEGEMELYIILRDITDTWFLSLPTIRNGQSWTVLLLQEVLRLRPDLNYHIIFPELERQALDAIGVALVPNRSDIMTFADIVHHYCFEREWLGKKIPAEELRISLREAGMIDGNKLINNLHKVLKDYRFIFTDGNKMVKILER